MPIAGTSSIEKIEEDSGNRSNVFTAEDGEDAEK